jgi:hypothetical protein
MARSIVMRLLGLTICAVGVFVSAAMLRQPAGVWSDSPRESALSRPLVLSAEAGSATLPIYAPAFSKHGFALERFDVPAEFAALALYMLIGSWLFVVGNPRRQAAVWEMLPVAVAGAGALAAAGWIVVRASSALMVRTGDLLNGGVIVLLAIALGFAAHRTKEPPERIRLVPASRLATSAVAFAVVLIAIAGWFRREQLALGAHIRDLRPNADLVAQLRSNEAFLLRDYYAQAQRPELIDESDALPAVTVFIDYGVPASICAANRVIEVIEPAFAGQVHTQWRQYPHASCDGFSLEHPQPGACLAAFATEAARLQGGDAVVRDVQIQLFIAGRKLNVKYAVSMAAEFGFDVARFERDLFSDDVRARVAADAALATALGVARAPAIFLNGRRVTEFGVDNPIFWRAVAMELAAPIDASVASVER